ncbi:hypothetical protein LPJ66_011529 [Kickxella alabastrina]|uniref:Uncharacterized protein n=1 Tax=Kickxella alabastrina TaxID=61397 RepID=A0ACC1I3D1_9FUNG|nr:hypothetical protein LPJ66_011529 [Kickxella alabastrina]
MDGSKARDRIATRRQHPTASSSKIASARNNGTGTAAGAVKRITQPNKAVIPVENMPVIFVMAMLHKIYTRILMLPDVVCGTVKHEQLELLKLIILWSGELDKYVDKSRDGYEQRQKNQIHMASHWLTRPSDIYKIVPMLHRQDDGFLTLIIQRMESTKSSATTAQP